MSSVDNDADKTFDEISMWTVSALRDYLRARNLPNSNRSKQALVALVYGCMQLQVEPVQSAVDLEIQTKQEYRSLLQGSDFQRQDPRSIQDWTSEADGMAHWPKVLFSDLIVFTNISNGALSCNMYTKYKQGKGYSYFQDGWIGEIESNITHESNICYFRTKCIPSERINSPPHDLWIATCLNTGEILGAFMHCEALEHDPSENSRNATSTYASVPYPVNRVAVIVRGYEYNSVGELSYLQNSFSDYVSFISLISASGLCTTVVLFTLVIPDERTKDGR